MRAIRWGNPKTSRRPGGYYRCSTHRVFSMLMEIVTAEIRIEKYSVTTHLFESADESLHARVSSGVACTRFVRHHHMSVSDKDV